MDYRRSNPEQFTLMVDFMERNGDLARPLQGPQGRIKSDEKWQELSTLLNSCGGGVNKPVEKWKRVWVDWKAKTKKKALLVRRDAQGTGGGPSRRQALTALEERVLAIMGLSAVVGQDDIPERGFDVTHNNPIAGGSTSSQQIHTIVNSEQQVAMEVIIDVHRGSENHSSTSEALPSLPSQTPPQYILLPPHTPSAPLAPQPPPHVPLTPSHTPLTAPEPSRASPSPLRTSEHSSPHEAVRRRRIQTPFERAANEFVSIELNRLRLEKIRERQLHQRELERERLSHDREMERERLLHERERDCLQLESTA